MMHIFAQWAFWNVGIRLAFFGLCCAVASLVLILFQVVISRSRLHRKIAALEKRVAALEARRKDGE